MAGYTKREKVVVIGAGISGLACAYRLKQLGLPALVLEAANRPGGCIHTIRKGGSLFELGPQCPRFPAALWQLVCELGLERDFVAGKPNAKRYIYRNRRLHLAPFSPAGLLRTSLVSRRTKLRILGEVFQTSRPPQREETLAAFVARKFGNDVLENLVDPIVATVFLGDADRLGMESAFPALRKWEENHGSLVRGALRARGARREPDPNGHGNPPPAKDAKGGPSALRVTDSLPSLGSFRTGMGQLTESLASALGPQLRYGSEIVAVAQDRSDSRRFGWRIQFRSGGSLCAEHLVFAVPAYVIADLLRPIIPALTLELEEIEYAPLALISSVYRRNAVQNALDGFGFMVPRKEGLHTICTFWNSSLFEERTPEGHALITSFARTDTGSGAPSEDEVQRSVQQENARILGIVEKPVDQVFWSDSRALPQYNVGHQQRIARIEDALALWPDLAIIGNFLKGRSIGECVELANATAEQVFKKLSGGAGE